jgi:hypothetical protein
MRKNSEIDFYLDIMILEAIFSDDKMVKNASVGGDIVSKIREYFGSKFDTPEAKEDKAGTFINLIAPRAISVLFKSLGFGKIGMLLGLMTSIFHVDVNSILHSIWEKFKQALGSKEKLSSGDVDNIVQSSVQEHDKPASEKDLAALPPQTLSKFQMLDEARRFKMVLSMYEQNITLNKTAFDFGKLLPKFMQSKSTHTSMFSTVLSTIFKIGLTAAGLMVAGDVANKLLGRKNDIDGKNGPTESAPSSNPAPVMHVATQTRFKANPSVQDSKHGSTWSIQVTNEPSAISALLVKFAKEVYSGLDGLESVITSSPHFQAVLNDIVWYNHNAKGDPVIFIPNYFTSKKSIVDYFIDEVAQKAPKT